MSALYLIPGFLMIGFYLIVVGVFEDRRRKTSFAVTLREYSSSERRQWRRSVREFGRQSASAPHSHLGIDDVPTVFLLAEKMRLESAERMKPFLLVMTFVLLAGDASIMLAQGRWAPGVGDLAGLGVAGLVVLTRALRERHRQSSRRVPKSIRTYEQALELRGR
jgi:hypothetical protein